MTTAWSAAALSAIDSADELRIAVRAITDVADRTDLRDAVDAAYRAQYGAGTDRMTGTEAAATTLRLDPVD